MSFARIKALGWAYLEILTSGQQTQLDIDHANAVDGAAGGSYAGPLAFTNIIDLLVTDTGKTVRLASRSVPRVMPGQPAGDSTGNWIASANSYWQTTANTAASLIWTVQFPAGATITRVDLPIIGAGAHAGLPANLPTITLVEAPFQPFGGVSVVGTQADTSANTGAYQAAHTISKTGLAKVVDPTAFFYQLIVVSESGANALSGLKVAQPKFFFDSTRLDEL